MAANGNEVEIYKRGGWYHTRTNWGRMGEAFLTKWGAIWWSKRALRKYRKYPQRKVPVALLTEDDL